MKSLHLGYENASIMVKALYEARFGNIAKPAKSNLDKVWGI